MTKTTLTLDELLVLLMEECAEVTKAASKCLRFGYETIGPNDYGKNDHVLSAEVGDLFGVLEAIPMNFRIINAAKKTKIERAEKAKELYGVRRTLGSEHEKR